MDILLLSKTPPQHNEIAKTILDLGNPHCDIHYCENIYEFFELIKDILPVLAIAELELIESKIVFSSLVNDARTRLSNNITRFVIKGLNEIRSCFDYGADYFIPTPFESEILKNILLRSFVNDLPKAEQEDSSCNTLIINTNNCTYILQLSQLVMIKSEQLYSHFYLENGNVIVSSRNLGYYEKMLEGNKRMIRVHRKVILNIDFIKGFNNKTEKMILLKPPFKPIKASRSRFREMLLRLQLI